MSVINFNTAKPLRKGDNGEYHILCKRKPAPADLFHFPKLESSPFHFPNTVKEEGFVIKTVPLGVVSSASKMVWPRKPVRRIVARTPETSPYRPGSSYLLTHYLDTLECGHQVTTYKFEEFKKRRGCQLCLDGLAIPVSEKVAA